MRSPFFLLPGVPLFQTTFMVSVLMVMYAYINWKSEGPYDVEIRVLVHDDVLEVGLKQDIHDWLQHSKTIFKDTADIQIFFTKQQNILLPARYHQKITHHNVTEMMRELGDIFQEENESLLVFMAASNDAGKSSADSGASIIFLGLQNNPNDAYLTRKWLVAHEISHLFGTDDFHDEHNILDQDEIFSVTEKTEPALHFDEHSIEIMKTAKEYMVKNKTSAFSFIHSDINTGQKIIPHLKALQPKLRRPFGFDAVVGAFYLRNGEYSTALTHLNKAIQMITENPDQHIAPDLVLYNKGVTLFHLNRYEEAIIVFERSLEKGPPTPYNKWYFLGECLQFVTRDTDEWSEENKQKIIHAFKKATEHHPNHAWSWYKRAESELYNIPLHEWESEETERVVSHLKTCLELNSNHIHAVKLIGTILANQDKKSEADEYFQKVAQYSDLHQTQYRKKEGVYTSILNLSETED